MTHSSKTPAASFVLLTFVALCPGLSWSADGACCSANGTCADVRDYESCDGVRHDGLFCHEVVCPTCGNGTLDASEQCDDGNDDETDCCLGDCQLPSHDGCTTSVKSSTLISTDKLTWTWKKGGATTRDDFGDPTDSTQYALCIESIAPASTALASAILIPPGTPPWAGRKNWKLSSPSLPQFSGLTNVLLKPGAAGKAAIKLKGSGEALPTVDVDREGSIRVALRSSDGQCWSSGVMPIKSADGSTIKAKR